MFLATRSEPNALPCVERASHALLDCHCTHILASKTAWQYAPVYSISYRRTVSGNPTHPGKKMISDVIGHEPVEPLGGLELEAVHDLLHAVTVQLEVEGRTVKVVPVRQEIRRFRKAK